jgi:hypothetical protein
MFDGGSELRPYQDHGVSSFLGGRQLLFAKSARIGKPYSLCRPL